jgi:putative membrane protein
VSGSQVRWLLWRWLTNALALGLAVAVFGEINGDNPYWTIALGGAVFALINLALKPILTILSLPLIVITLGLFLFLLNMFMLWIVTELVSDLVIDGFWSYAGAAVAVWLVNMLLNATQVRTVEGPRNSF